MAFYPVAQYYLDYFKLGVGYGNLLSFGCFNDYKALGTLYVKPSVYNGRTITSLDSSKITEKIDYSWYTGSKQEYKPTEEMPKDNMKKDRAYTWVKAARYEGVPYEVGPLVRMFLSGEYTNGISMMDRTIARVLEAKKITDIIGILLENIIPNVDYQQEYSLPQSTQGYGLIDTTRGALGHWLKIDKGVISFYQIITPTVWNLSAQDMLFKGTIEQALLGTIIQNIENPVELGRIIRSFDPCVS
jgi:hydrogenase large subunit